MERLWAPWRMEYLQGEHVESCIFCEKPAEEDDRANFLLYRGEHAYILINIYPYSNGHLMVAPYAHVAQLTDLDEAVRVEIMELTTLCTRLLSHTSHPTGFNLGANMGKAAGAGFDEHFHMHIVPRWLGDTNFMPVVGNTRVIPESLDETYERLKQALAEIQ
ncbi:MAG: HIT domain-containing protein [Anaerolineae bacterium]